MNEIMKVKVSGVTLGMSQEACGALSDYIATLERAYGTTPEGKEVVADIEARIVELILEQQKAEEVVEKPLIDTIIATLGYPEGCEQPESTNHTQAHTAQTTQNQGCLYALGSIVRFCLKALAVLILAGCIITSLCVIVGIIVLLTTDAALSSEVVFTGVSPIGFAALICGSFLAFMVALTYLLVCLVGSKKVKGRTMLFIGILWLILTVWAWVGMGTNLANWDHWGYTIEMNDDWAEEFERLAKQFDDKLESNLEDLEEGLETLEDELERNLEDLEDNLDALEDKLN